MNQRSVITPQSLGPGQSELIISSFCHSSVISFHDTSHLFLENTLLLFSSFLSLLSTIVIVIVIASN
jgi:hypothetical protein